MWPQAVQEFLANGGAPNFHVAVVIRPVNLASGQTEELSFWSGHEDIVLDLSGNKTLIATKGALKVDAPTYSEGTNIRQHSTSMFGLSSHAVSLLQAYSVRFKDVQTWQLCYTQGSRYIGARRLFNGIVDGMPQTIAVKGGGTTLTIQMVSEMRKGTRTLASKKSHESYQLRNGDTSMQYASLTAVDSDWWGARG